MRNYSREEALELAKQYNMEDDVRYCIDTLGYSPNEALMEWYLYPFEP